MSFPPMPDKDAATFAIAREDYAALDVLRRQYEARRNAIEQDVVQRAVAKRERRAERNRKLANAAR